MTGQRTGSEVHVGQAETPNHVTAERETRISRGMTGARDVSAGQKPEEYTHRCGTESTGLCWGWGDLRG